jgi:hypothetical protein
MRSHCRRLLVPHVDRTETNLDAARCDIDHRSAGKIEDRIYAFVLQ